MDLQATATRTSPRPLPAVRAVVACTAERARRRTPADRHGQPVLHDVIAFMYWARSNSVGLPTEAALMLPHIWRTDS